MRGPLLTIEAAVFSGGFNDTIILMEGVYEGYNNTRCDIFDQIDNAQMKVIGFGAPQDCILNIFEYIEFSDSNPNTETSFQNVTFTSDVVWSSYRIFSIYNTSNIYFIDCIFTGFNYYNPDAVLFDISQNAAPSFIGCTFDNNDMRNLLVAHDMDVNLIVDECIFEQNTFDIDYYDPSGPPMTMLTVEMGATARVDTCVVRNNSTRRRFLVFVAIDNAFLNISNCVIENNQGLQSYSADAPSCCGIAILESTVYVSNTQIQNLEENTSTSSPFIPNSTAIAADAPILLDVSNCQLNNNNTGILIGMGNPPYGESIVNIRDTEICDNTYDSDDLYASSAGILLYDQGDEIDKLTIQNCTIQNNYKGIWCLTAFYSNQILVENCLIANNEFTGIRLIHNGESEGSVDITNCTVADNGEYGIFTHYAVVKNSIAWDNTNDSIRYDDFVTVNYSDVQNGWAGSGTGNIDIDPGFAQPGVDYHLLSTAGRFDPPQEMVYFDASDSPCIDAGDPADPAIFEPYGSGGRVNMGAYGGTWQASRTDICTGGFKNTGILYGDVNYDCEINLTDFAIMASSWLQNTKTP